MAVHEPMALGVELSNWLRIFAIFLGGFVVGFGTITLRNRARWYCQQLDDPRTAKIGKQAMNALAIVNLLVLSYITSTVLSHWDAPLTFRTPLALTVFSVKAFFFWRLRQLAEAQEREYVFGGRPRPVVP